MREKPSRQLAAHRAGQGQARVGVCKEPSRVGLDLRHSEPGARIGALHHDARGERAPHAADAVHDPRRRVPHGDGVGERDPRRAGLTHRRLVDVRRRRGGRVKVALEVREGDVVADGVGGRVEAKVEGPRGAGQAAGGLGPVDDLLGRGVGEHGRREPEEPVGVAGGRCGGCCSRGRGLWGSPWGRWDLWGSYRRGHRSSFRGWSGHGAEVNLRDGDLDGRVAASSELDGLGGGLPYSHRRGTSAQRQKSE